MFASEVEQIPGAKYNDIRFFTALKDTRNLCPRVDTLSYIKLTIDLYPVLFNVVIIFCEYNVPYEP